RGCLAPAPRGWGPRARPRGRPARPQKAAAGGPPRAPGAESRKPQAGRRTLLESGGMRPPVELGEATAPSLLDGALALALATGAPLRMVGPINGADALLVLAAARLGDAGTLEATRAALARTRPAAG